MTLGQGVLLAVGAIVLVLIVPRPRRARRPPSARGGRAPAPRAPRPQRHPDLAAVDRLLSMAVSSAEDEYVRLRPLVRDIARQRLADHTGVRLETAPGRGRRDPRA